MRSVIVAKQVTTVQTKVSHILAAYVFAQQIPHEVTLCNAIIPSINGTFTFPRTIADSHSLH